MGSKGDQERAARLEAELRSNLKKRKEQARARTRAGGSGVAGDTVRDVPRTHEGGKDDG